MKRAGIPLQKLASGSHAFRHLVGSLIHKETGSLKLAQKQLGHANVSTTGDIYTHIEKTLLILLAVPFSAIGAIWFIHWLGYNMSIAVWVGLIELLGVDAETAVFMLLYLDLAYQERLVQGKMRSMADLKEAIEYGAVKRLRPKVMTVGVMFMGLAP